MRLIAAITVVALSSTGCRSRSPQSAAAVRDDAPAGDAPAAAAEPEGDTTEAATGLSACQKQDDMWTKHLLPTAYKSLPALSAPGPLDIAIMTEQAFTAKSFSDGGDVIRPGRRKLVHTFGAVAKLTFDPSAGAAASGFTGFFKDGAKCMIGRFSVASKPSTDGMIPALALKFFADGDVPSVNLHLMHAIDAQAGHNFFQETFSNRPSAPTGAVTKVLSNLFFRGAKFFGAKDPTSNTLTIEHVAAHGPDGAPVAAPVAPFKITLQPLSTVNTFMKGNTVDTDFRRSLAQIAENTPLYEVFVSQDETPGTSIGRLVLTSPIVASRFGDESLWFQHNKLR